MTLAVLNAGSSSLKYAVFDDELRELARGAVDADGPAGHAAAVRSALAVIERHAPRVIGHRLVHGGPAHTEPAIVDDALLAELEGAIGFAPLHLPIELAAIATVRAQFSALPQVVCFDTGFHRTMPEVARRFALPARVLAGGIRRYGFHGLAFESVAAALPPERLRRAIFAHLGSGASMVAVRDGRSVDTTMGLTPTGGLVMATRTGDLDPGLLLYLLEHGHDAGGLAQLVDHEAGLRGISETTADMRELLELRATDPRAKLAIDVFCYQARKAIGALAAVLGGVETLVFSGGIGEHAEAIRREICHGLAHLGIGTGACEVRVIRADEERAIAGHARRLI